MMPFDIHYPEGATIGYKWYDQQKLPLYSPLVLV